MKTFLFYDIETSGLNPAFDQILTFASIKTDYQLNELERHTITVQLRTDVVPSPQAFLTHGLTFAELESGITEYEAAKKIHALVNMPDTISVGYNSLGFDDEFLRFLFYRNLLDPYSHQYNRGCSRMDVLPITTIYKLFGPEKIISWPRIDNKSTLKLEHISKENRFVTSGRAHEAMSDVEAVVALSKAFFKKHDIWKYCLDFFNKTKDEIRINNIKPEIKCQNRSFRLCLMVSTSFGPDNHYIAPVIQIGQSLAYKNQTLWLRLDSEDILGIDSERQISETFVIRKKAGDEYIVLPPLKRFWKKLTSAAETLSKKSIDCIQEHWALFYELVQYHCEFKYPFVPHMDMDATLYQEGFFSKIEKQESRRFHNTDPDQKYAMLDKFTSQRVRKLAGRILFRNFSGIFSQELETLHQSHLARLKSEKSEDQFVGFRNDSKLNVSAARKDLLEAKNTLTNPTTSQHQMMVQLETYLSGL